MEGEEGPRTPGEEEDWAERQGAFLSLFEICRVSLSALAFVKKT